MANINTPAHDFAPPWLKVPSYDTSKPSGSDSSYSRPTHRKDDRGYGSFRSSAKDGDGFPSRSTYLTDSRRERNNLEYKPSYLSSRHHSLDFDDTPFNGGSAQCNGDVFNNTSCSFQSVISRRPHSRHDFRNIPTSHVKGELFNRHASNNIGGYYGNKSKSKYHDTSSSNFDSISRIGVTSNNFNAEFPSLQGDITEEPGAVPPSQPSVNGSVWEKPRNIKVHSVNTGKKIQLVKKQIATDGTAEGSKKGSSLSSSSVFNSSGPVSSTSNSHTAIASSTAKSGPGIYRALVPPKKTLLKEGNSKVLAPLKKPVSCTPLPSAHTMEVLVKHPKAPGNKSEFLKALRNESKNTSTSESNGKDHEKNATACSEDESEDQQTSGINISKLSISHEGENGENILSSSLEAEQRLLREMGWKEEVSDDDNYAPLTEDEMREFRALSEQLMLTKKKNGFQRNLQINTSPHHLASFSNASLPANDSDSSSSESDSDF